MDPITWILGVPGAGGVAYGGFRLARWVHRNWPTVKAVARAVTREVLESDPACGNGSMRDGLKRMEVTLGEVHKTTTLVLAEQADQRREHDTLRLDMGSIRLEQTEVRGRVALLESGAIDRAKEQILAATRSGARRDPGDQA